jgi:hypothetical protein
MLLLDAGGAFLLIPFFIAFHLLLTVLIEGGVLRIFKYNTFGRCMRDAFVANFLSLIGGFLILIAITTLGSVVSANTELHLSNNQYMVIMLLFTFVITLIIETRYLQYSNENLPYKTLLTASLVGNGLTYLLLIGFFKMI